MHISLLVLEHLMGTGSLLLDNQVVRAIRVNFYFAEIASADFVLEEDIEVCICEAFWFGKAEVCLHLVRLELSTGRLSLAQTRPRRLAPAQKNAVLPCQFHAVGFMKWS
jgi:hypothetical protein